MLRYQRIIDSHVYYERNVDVYNFQFVESRKSEFLGENDEEMDKNIVDNSYSYFTFVCGNVLFYRNASFYGVYSIGYL